MILAMIKYIILVNEDLRLNVVLTDTKLQPSDT